MSELALRPAVFEDWALLLDWVNQPDSLAGKLRTSEPIDADTHKAWLKRFLGSGASRLFIVLMANQPIGQIRFQPNEDGVFVIDVYVTADRRGGGVARSALEHGMAQMTENTSPTQFQAEVRIENTASHRLFKGLGFAEISRTNDHLVYERKMTARRA
jgi:RimJ/RimL family protein N-acetyltransferase